MLNLELMVEFFRWLMGIEPQEPQPLYIPIEEERREDR